MSDIPMQAQSSVAWRKVAFLTVLFVATVGTTAVFPILGEGLNSRDAQQNGIILLLGWFSTAHVAVTGFYYGDKEFIPHIVENRMRYIYAPALIIGISIVAWGLAVGTPYFWVFSHFTQAWLLWHYMRQNIGVSALVAQSTGSARIGTWDRRAITIVGAGAILGAARFGLPLPVSHNVAHLIGQLGLAIYLIGAGIGVIAIFRRLRLAKSDKEWVTAAFVFASVLFFAPTFLAKSYYPAIMSYAIAHALQYWVLMSLIAIGSGRISGWVRSIAAFAFFVAVIWLFVDLSRQGALWGTWAAWVAGVGIGLTFAHFIVDADSWRLREAFQRSYVMARLGRFMN